MRATSTKTEIFVWLFVALTGLYIGLFFALPADPKALEQFQINQNQYRALLLTIVAPLMGVFYAALYGFVKFKNYAESIQSTKEGPGFRYLANALMVLAFSLPITSDIGALLNYITLRNPDLKPTSVIIQNYVALLFPLVMILLIVKGTTALISTLRVRMDYPPHYSLLAIISLTSLYTWLITRSPATAQDTYFLPHWLIISTLLIPYVFIWSHGIVAMYKLFEYQRYVKGKTYRMAIRDLTLGIATIIGLSIIIQLLTTLSDSLNSLTLRPILGILYVLVIMYAIGYGFVARGAKKLKQIEEA